MQIERVEGQRGLQKVRTKNEEIIAIKHAQAICKRLDSQIGDMAIIRQEVENNHDAGYYVAIRISPFDDANLKLVADAVSKETQALHINTSTQFPIVISFI